MEATPERAARGAGEHAVDAPQHGWPHVWLQAGKSKRRRLEGKCGLSGHVSETECLAATAAAHVRAQQADAYEMAQEMKTVFMAKKKGLGAKGAPYVPSRMLASDNGKAGSSGQEQRGADDEQDTKEDEAHHKKGQGLAATPGLTKDRKVEEVDQVKKERCASGVNDLHKKASLKKRKLDDGKDGREEGMEQAIERKRGEQEGEDEDKAEEEKQDKSEKMKKKKKGKQEKRDSEDEAEEVREEKREKKKKKRQKKADIEEADDGAEESADRVGRKEKKKEKEGGEEEAGNSDGEEKKKKKEKKGKRDGAEMTAEATNANDVEEFSGESIAALEEEIRRLKEQVAGIECGLVLGEGEGLDGTSDAMVTAVQRQKEKKKKKKKKKRASEDGEVPRLNASEKEALIAEALRQVALLREAE